MNYLKRLLMVELSFLDIIISESFKKNETKKVKDAQK